LDLFEDQTKVRRWKILKILAAGFIPGAEEYNGHREAGRHGFAPSPGPRIRQTFTSPPLKGAPKIKHASEKT
jgi:hypothetical protein